MPPAHPTSPGLSVQSARHAILAPLTPLAGREQIGVRDALGRVLAQDIIAPCNVPAHDNSAMDGYALGAAHLCSTGDTLLQIVGTALAGRPFPHALGPGQAVRIMTGAVIPQGADCVVEQEAVRAHPHQVWIPPGRSPGQNLRRAGEDLSQGGLALPAGKRVGPAEMGLIASLGIPEVWVYPRLRVAFFSTGDEIASIGEPLAPGQIYDSNRYTLLAALTRLGCEVLDLGVVPDQPAALEAALARAAASAEVIITSGGVSVGEADFIKEIMARMGQVAFWKLDLKPGRPMAFGQIGKTWLFGLPGNPVAVMVTFYQLVQDALLTLMGMSPLPIRPSFPARCDCAIRKQPGRREFVRGRLQADQDGWSVTLAGPQGSGILRSMSEANCFIVLPEALGAVAPGEMVEVQLFEGLM